ncbi:MAG: hypothetical protein AAFW65_06680 [Pseudomonadota bacterium]
MRKWLILIVILALAVLGVAFWLGQGVNDYAPEEGEVRIEIEEAL